MQVHTRNFEHRGSDCWRKEKPGKHIMPRTRRSRATRNVEAEEEEVQGGESQQSQESLSFTEAQRAWIEQLVSARVSAAHTTSGVATATVAAAAGVSPSVTTSAAGNTSGECRAIDIV